MQQTDTTYRFTLEKYHGPGSRYTCPSCGQARTFVRYIDTEGKIIFPNNVGKCNRENNCGYHYTPKEYFKDNPDAKKALKEDALYFEKKDIVVEKPKPPPESSFIPRELMQRTLSHYGSNNFAKFLSSLYDDQTANQMLSRYYIGTSKHWDGATVFWQVDADGRVHHGKVMVYDPVSGKRSHSNYHFSTAECLMHMKDFHLEQCFFGEHLLVDKTKPVALVESEKSAVIASQHIPYYIWLASGGSSGCLNQRMHILSDRQVVMFPDMKCLADWQIKASKLRLLGAQVEVSSFLEDNATENELADGLDIADYIIQSVRDKKNKLHVPLRAEQLRLEGMLVRHPELSILINKLQLEITA